jgi:eukaryotic-like serine/threonine-protein kinase
MSSPGLLLVRRYRLDSWIATGGVGEVWRATDLVLGRPVAVKLLQERYAGHAETLARFRAEAQHAGALSHPGIAQVYDYGETDPPGPPYLVLELVDGPSLAGVLTDGPLEPVRAMDVVAQAAAGLAAAHVAGLVHRDIKPANLLMGPGGIVKITDFGIAHAAGSAQLTRTGMLVGTPAYLAPERAAGDQATPASDLYSLGIVAYECLAGTPPFRGTPLEIAAAIQHQPIPPLPATVPAPVAALVAELTARDPASRPASAGQVAARAAGLRDALRDVAAGLLTARAAAAPSSPADGTPVTRADARPAAETAAHPAAGADALTHAQAGPGPGVDAPPAARPDTPPVTRADGSRAPSMDVPPAARPDTPPVTGADGPPAPGMDAPPAPAAGAPLPARADPPLASRAGEPAATLVGSTATLIGADGPTPAARRWPWPDGTWLDRLRPDGSWRRWAAGLAAAVAGVAALVGWLLAGGGSPSRPAQSATRPAAARSHSPAHRVEVNPAALARQPADQVSQRLAQLGLRPQVVGAVTGRQPPGTVVSVQPSGQLTVGSVVTVFAAVGPPGHGNDKGNGNGGDNGNGHGNG